MSCDLNLYNTIESLDEQYIVYYLIVAIISFLMVLGYQNIVYESIPMWSTPYYILNLMITVSAFVGIIFIRLKKRLLSYRLSIVLFLVFISTSILTFIMMFGFDIHGGVLFRTSFYVIGSWALWKRIGYVKTAIKSGL